MQLLRFVSAEFAMQIAQKTKKYLACSQPDKDWAIQKIVRLLVADEVIPAFSSSVIKLGHLTSNPTVSMNDIREVIELDPGLSSDCIKVASSVGFAAHRISSIQQALMLIGVEEIRRIAFSVGVMEKFDGFRDNVNWGDFWLHSVLVARLTEKVAGAYRPCSGSEYLAGLLHDCGKILLEKHFPEQFDSIVSSAKYRKCSHVMVERDIIGVTHAQIGGAICDILQAHNEVIQAVWHHHGPFVSATGLPNNSKFLAACIAVGDALANYAQANISGARIMDKNKLFEQLPEWRFLSQYHMTYGLQLDLEAEVVAAAQDLKAFSG